MIVKWGLITFDLSVFMHSFQSMKHGLVKCSLHVHIYIYIYTIVKPSHMMKIT